MRPKPLLRPPPKAVLNWKSWMHCTSCTSGEGLHQSALDLEDRPKWLRKPQNRLEKALYVHAVAATNRKSHISRWNSGKTLSPQLSATLYMLFSFSDKSFLETLAMPGWITSSTNCLRPSKGLFWNFRVRMVNSDIAS